jgi:D-alanyl-lipoteichoic acid acyltransferase DltB (MBOAT superfamily)
MSTEPSASAAATSTTFARYGFLASLLLQITLIGLTLRRLDILQPTFRYVAYLAFGAFPIYFSTPRKWRLTFFVGLSLAATLLVLGSDIDIERLPTWSLTAAFARGGVLVTSGVAIIALCRLAVSFRLRVGLVTLAGLAVASARQGLLPGLHDLDAVWIILASMFMFRTMIYLYETSTATIPATWQQSLAYFFMLPNACCTLFPTVDFNTFARSHLADEDVSIHQRGVQRMIRGLIQLLMYRYVAQIFLIPVTMVDGGKSLLVFVVTNMLVYLNVSGQFHFITGLLLLYGFNLPETNRRYFLASSFSDYWRRVNIYWKDFILRVFYYPAFFKLKRFGNTPALVVATLWSFIVTWALHLYQTWWLTGSVTLALPGALFWSTLGLLVVANSLWEARSTTKKPSLARRHGPWRDALVLGAQTAATFAAISVLWSLWSSPSLAVWLRAWGHANRDTAYGSIVVLLCVAIAKIVIDARPWTRRVITAHPTTAPAGSHWRAAGAGVATILFVLLTSHVVLRAHWDIDGLQRFDARWEAQHVADVLEAGGSLIPQEQADQLDYYRRLSTLDEGNRQLLEILIRRFIPDAPRTSDPPVVATKEFPFDWMKPLAHGPAYETREFETNRWGMRDRDYSAIKPSNTVRIALLGSSHTMGYAVSRDEDFESRLERTLNERPHAALSKPPIVEILNFAQAGFSPLDQVGVLQRRVKAFSPDIVLFVAHLEDLDSTNKRLRRALRRGPIPFPFVNDVLARSRVDALTLDGLAERRLGPFEPTLALWAYKELAAGSRAMGAWPAYFFVPAPGWELPLTAHRAEQADALERLARAAGFDVLDGRHTFDGYDPDALFTGLSPHSNALAHGLIADALLASLKNDTRIARLLDFGRVRDGRPTS